MANADRQNLAGQVQLLGRYRLRGVLGQGGMGRLYVAEQKGIEGFTKIVAVKQILPHLADSPHFRRMFLTEARVAARLDHPNIVVTYELGEVDGIYFMAMEYLPGEDLGAALSRARGRAIPVEIAVGTAHQALSGLSYAHDLRDGDGRPAGIVHRDVNPSNIFVTYYGMVKLLDFGVVKGAGGPGTSPGTFKGKYGYCAPEQLEGDTIDRRTDVFCVGIVLWESLTGQTLFKGHTDAQVIDAVRGSPIHRPSAIRPDLPEELDHITMRALSRKRESRYQSAHEMAEALDRFMSNRPRSTPKSIGQWLEGLFGSDRAQLKKDIAQGNDIEKTLDRLRAMTSSAAVSAPASQDNPGSQGGQGSSGGQRRSGSVGEVAGGVSRAPGSRAGAPVQPRTLWSTSVRKPTAAGVARTPASGVPVRAPAIAAPPAAPARAFMGYGEDAEGAVAAPDKPVEEATSRFVVPQELAEKAGFSEAALGAVSQARGSEAEAAPAPERPALAEATARAVPPRRPASGKPLKVIAVLGLLGAAAAMVISLGDGGQDGQVANTGAVMTSGSVELKSDPPGANVLIDGEPTGLITPTVLANLRRGGTLEVRLDKPGFETAIQKITVPKEGQGSSVVKLVPAGGSVRLDGLPEGASVFVDDVGTEARSGPLNVGLGPHRLRVEKGGEVVFEQTIQVLPGEQSIQIRPGGKGR